MKWIFLAYLILNPLFYITGVENQRVVQELFFQLSSAALFMCGMFFDNKKIKLSKLNVAIGIMGIAFLFAAFKTTKWGIAYNYLAGILVYLTAIRTLRKEDIKFLFKGITWMALFAVFYFLLQVFGFDMRGATTTVKTIPTTSIFFHRSSFGMYIAQAIPIVMCVNPLGIGLFLALRESLCAGAYVGATAGILFYLWFRKRIMFWIILILIIPASMYYLIKDENIKGFELRVPLWKIITHSIAQRPIGYGLDSFANGNIKYYKYAFSNRFIKFVKNDDGWSPTKKEDNEFLVNLKGDEKKMVFLDHPHNEYFWLGYEVGVQGLVILGFILYFMWMRFWRSFKDKETVALAASIVSILIFCLVQFPMHLARLAHLYPIILGCFFVLTEEEEK